MRLVLVALLLFGTIPPAHAFYANLTASPDPNTGDFDVTWNNPSSKTYKLQEKPTSGSWATVYTGKLTSYSFTGHASGDFSFRLKHTGTQCSGWPEPECFQVTTYSETETVTVNEPPPPGGGGSWTAPTTNIQDAAIVNPTDPVGDTGMISVGALNGSGGVSGGQATYNIPIALPPGRKGMQPNVSLNYSSSSGNGLAGVGWGVSANSAITRCAASAAQDGFTASVQYDSTRDRLCLDGQRLVAETGHTYGASGARYRTELESFTQVTQSGSLNGSTTSFTVRYKNGRTGYFGSTTNSRHKASGRNEVLTWAVADMRDPSGNTVTYHYSQYGDGEWLLDSIDYTGHNGSNGNRHVVFDYAARPDEGTSYRAGGKTRSTQRLSKITTKYGTTVVHEYTLNYGAVSVSSERSLLRSVQECAYKGGSQHCLPATTFEWLEANPVLPKFVGERLQFFDPDDLINGIPDPNTGGEIVLHDKRWLHDVLPQGDRNGDGVKDWDGFFANAEGVVTDPNTGLITNCFRTYQSWTLTCLQVDFDADGKTDSFRQNNNKLELMRASTPGVWINTGIDWLPQIGSRDDTPLSFADFDGDGWIDLVIRQSDTIWVYLHTQNVTAPYSTSQRQSVITLPVNASATGYMVDAQVYGDMDGNGTPDFVVSDLSVAGKAPGLPYPQYAILTHSQSGGGFTTSTMTMAAFGTQYVNANILFDVNGDGLPDVLSLQLSGSNYTLHYQLNTGGGFTGTWTDLGFAPPVTMNWRDEGGQYPEPIEYYMPIMSRVLIMDHNGDGQQDLLVANDVLASGCAEVLTTGGPVWACDDALYNEFDINPNTLVGAPINSNVADNSVRAFGVWTFDEDASGTITASWDTTDIKAAAAQTAVVDATGDGLPDVVTVFGCRVTQCEFNTEIDPNERPGTVQDPDFFEGAYINRNLGTATDVLLNGVFEYQAYDMMNATETGLDVRTEWVYRPLSSDAYDVDVVRVSDFYVPDDGYINNDPEYFHFASSMNVVAESRASNGIGGLNSTLYRYRGAIYNNAGRGFQGFKTIITEQDIYDSGAANDDTDKITRTEFHQKWPYSGQLEYTCTWPAESGISNDDPGCDETPTSSVINQNNVIGFHDVVTSGTARFVAVSDTITKVYDLYNMVAGQELTSRTVSRTYDSGGNIDSETETHTDAYTTNEWGLTRSYTVDFVNWWLNKLNSDISTKKAVIARHIDAPPIQANTDNDKITTTTIGSYHSTHRLPTSVSVTANDTALIQTVTTGHNSYGLPTTVTTTGTDVTGPRTVTTGYSKNGVIESPDGYFPFTVTNILGHQVEQHTDPVHGQPTGQWDVNDQHTATSYDAFGRIEDVTGPGLPTAMTRYFWCDGYPTCPAGAKYKIVTVRAGAPEANGHIDMLGREIVSAVKNFADTGYINMRREYDERGHTTFESQPFDPTLGEYDSMGVEYQGFDALGRNLTKKVKQANGTTLVTNYLYQGFKTTITTGALPTMHRIYNGLGQLVETKDAEGGYVRYGYDGAGNPIALEGPAVAGAASPSTAYASFNALGLREWVDDPNMGVKSLTYSAVGEVKSETDGNSNVVLMDYDVLGRLTDRTVNGVQHGKWTYDDAASFKGLGLLDSEESATTTGITILKEYFYGDVATGGRKDVLEVKHNFTGVTLNGGASPINDPSYRVAYFYDSYYGRLKGQTYRYPDSISIEYLYNNAGHLTHERDASTQYVFRQVDGRSSRNQITSAYLADSAFDLDADYFHATGQAQKIEVTDGGQLLHRLEYLYETYGNLDNQTTNYALGAGTVSSTEGFTYDFLHRLTQSNRQINGGPSKIVDYDYDISGNIIIKSDYSTSYDYVNGGTGGGPNAVKKVTLIAGLGGGTVNFSYDSVGNMTIGDGKTVTYDAFSKPLTITSGGVTSTFHYGANLSRYAQVKTGIASSTTLYLDKLVEIEANGTKIDYRHYISNVAMQTETDTSGTITTQTNFLLRDRLGGVATIVDTGGTIVARTGYDPFGKPRDDDWDDLLTPVLPANHADTTPRGFTDHEHLDDSKLIHMNGRAFDYSLGRFLSVDPFIQAPGNSQSFNPYSYLMNNPLAGIDPSGYVASGVEVDCEMCNEADLADTGDSADFTVTWNETRTGSNIVTRRTSTGTASVTAKGNIHISASNGSSGSSGSARAAGSFGGGDDGGGGRAQDSLGSTGALGAFDVDKTDEEHIREYEASVQEHGVSSDYIYLGKDEKELKYEISGTDDFKKKVRADLNKLRRDKTGLEILRGVAESGRKVSFFATESPATTSRDAVEGHSIVGLLAEDTYSEVYFVSSSGQYSIPDFRTRDVVAHELVHVWQTSAAISPVPRIEAPVLFGRGFVDRQVQAIRYTNKIRREDGYGLIRVQNAPGRRRDLDVY